MKQLKISYAIYNKRDELLRQATYLTTCDDQMNPRILKTAMALLTVSSKVKGGYFVILDIEFKPEPELPLQPIDDRTDPWPD